MIVKMVKCDECGEIYDGINDKLKFKDRKWIAWGEILHYCKDCAKKITIYEIIKRQADKVEEGNK